MKGFIVAETGLNQLSFGVLEVMHPTLVDMKKAAQAALDLQKDKESHGLWDILTSKEFATGGREATDRSNLDGFKQQQEAKGMAWNNRRPLLGM